ncbi:MAG: HAMP domain-containing sensor histidine kinase [Flavitalea sp.]
MNYIYKLLSRPKFLAKSYTFKFLFVAFLGIHIPLLGLIGFILIHPDVITPGMVFIITLVLTLGATAATLFVLNGLLSPLQLTRTSLELYLSERKLPDLPLHYYDEAGILMSKVQQTVTSLDNLLEEKKDLIGLLSHDLRAPLASIQLLCDSMARDESMTLAESREYAAQMSQSAKEQLLLFQKILDILKNDRIEHIHLNLKQSDFTEVIVAAIHELKPFADRKSLKIDFDNTTSFDALADHTLIAQVVKNLLSNAIKFSKPHTRINIQLWEDEGQLNMAVQDLGLGFPPSDSEKIFQRFTTASKLGTEGEQSTGMGLYLSKRIVDAHRGHLTAFSEGTDRGSTFNLQFPKPA